jgi:hypothetical protein
MSVSSYWIKKTVLHNALNILPTHQNVASSASSANAPVFMLFDREEADVSLALADRSFDGTFMSTATQRVNNNAPAPFRLPPDSLAISEAGMLELNWNPINNEALYPYMNVTSDGKPRSFAVWISTLSAATFDRNYYKYYSDFKTKPNLWLTGTVGEYQSGADLEFEGLATWKIGRPLYMADNTLELPLRLLR